MGRSIVESDSSDATSLFSSEESVPPWALGGIVADIRDWATLLNLEFFWVRHNLVAHKVAGIALNSVDNFSWDVNFHAQLTSMMRSDLG